ncbi:MAG: hypothetical protein JWM58_3450 [Rhizobium sp.]|nr:hypothetical protein [Rhizobium sp.]
MGALHYVGRFLRSFFGTILLILLLLVSMIGYLGFTASGNQFLADRIADQISTSDMRISLEGASGLLEGRFHLDRMTLADTRGRFAEVEHLDVFWTPSELLKWRFHADRIAAAKVTVDRTPVKTIETSPSDSSFSLPVEVKIDSFDLPLVALGKAIARRDTVLSINGSAQAVSDRIAAELNVVEKDRVNATAKASLAYSVNARTLTLDGSISEPQGGLLARLLTLPGMPPVEVAVKGDGRLDDWKGSISGRVDGRDVLLLAGSYKKAAAGIHQIALNGGGEISEFMPAELRSLFSGETKVDVDARFSETGLVDIRTSSITNDSLTLFANGQLDPNGKATLTGDLRPAGDVVHFEWPLASGAVKADISKANVTFSGAFRSATIDISAVLANLSTTDMQAGNVALTANSSNLNLADKTGTLAYDLGVDTLAFANANIAKVVQGPVKLKGNLDIAGDVITLAQAELESARLGGKISGAFTRSTDTATADFNLFLLPRGLLPPDIESKIKGTLGLSGQLTATLPSQIAVRNLKLTSNLLTAVGSARFDGSTIKADLAGDVIDLAAMEDNAVGQAHFTLDASGPLARPDISAQITSAEAGFAGKTLRDIDLKFDSALDLSKPGGRLTAAATYQGEPIKAEVVAVFDAGRVAISALRADIGRNTISGALDLNAEFLPSGRFSFDFPEIAQLAKLAGQTAEGALNGTIDVAASSGRITGTVTATGPRLNTSGVEITNPTAKIEIADLLKQQLSAKVTADAIAIGTNHLDQVVLDAALESGQIPFDLKSRFDDEPLTAKGRIEPRDQGLTIKLASFAAAPRQFHLRLDQPTEIEIHDGVARLDNLTIVADGGKAILNGTAGKTLSLTTAVTDLPLSLANAFVDKLDATGDISANATITGEAASPNIQFDANIDNLATSQTRAAKLPDVSFTAKGLFVDNNSLSFDVTGNLRDQLVKATAQVKLDNGAVSISSFKADIGKASVSGTLALDRQSRPSGKIAFDIPDAGTLASIIGQKAEGALKGTVDLASAPDRIGAKVNATGSLRGQPVAAFVDAILDNGAVSLPSLKVDIGRNTLSGAVTLDKQFMPSGRIGFDFPDIALFAAMAGQTAEGALKGTVDITSDGGRIDAKIAATGEVRGKAIEIAAEAISDKGAISLPSLKATIGPNTLSGAVTLDSRFMPSGRITFDLPDVALLAAMAGQKAEGSVKGTADIASNGGKVDASVVATGKIRGQTIDVQTRVVAEDGVISVPSLKADIGANTITGGISLDRGFMPSGQFSFDFPDIGLLASFAGQQAEGALKGTAALQSTGGKIAGRISASGDMLSIAGARIVKPNIDLTISDLAAGRISGRVTAGQIAHGVNHLDLLALNIELVERQTRFDLSSQLDGAPLKAQGMVAQQPEDLRLTLSSFSASPRNIPVKLARPADILIRGGSAVLTDFAINAGDGTITVNGTAGKTLDLTAKLAELPLSLANVFSPELDAAGTISADIKITGEATAPIVTFDSQLRKVATRQTQGAELPDLDVTAKGRFDNNVLSIDAASSVRDQPVKAVAEIKLDNGKVAVPSFKADIGKSSFSGAVAFDPQFQPFGKITFDIPDANALAAIVGQKAEGALKGTADITSAGGKLNAKVDATGTIRKQPIMALADVSLINGAVSLLSLKLDVGRNTVSGAINLDRQFMPSGKIAFDFPDVALLAAMAGQKAEGAVKGTAEITADTGKIAAKVAATGRIRGQAIDVLVEGVQQNGAISLPSLKLDVGKNTLSGAITLDQRFMPTGKVTFDFPDIALLGAFAGQKAEGAITGSADIQSSDGKISGAISATGTRVNAFGAEIVKPVVDLKIADLTTGQISGSITADRIASGANVLSKLALDFDRAGNKTAFDLKGQYDAAPLTAKGAIEQQTDGIVISLASLSARPKSIPLKLDKPTEIRIKDGSVALADLSISAGNGSIVVTGAAGNKLDLTAKITALPANLANSFASNLGATGTVSANITVKGDSATPVVTFDTSWQNAAIGQSRDAGLSSFSVTAKGQLAKNVLSINADAKSGDGLSLNASGTVGVTGNNALAVKISGQLPFNALAAKLAMQGIDLKGNAQFDVTVSGTAANPSMTGRINTSGATLTVIRQNLTINSLAATVNLDGKQARIASFSGKLAGGGTVNISGTIGITPNQGFPADIKIALKNAVYTDGKVVAAKLSGDLGISGSLVGSPVLNGKIRLARADITIPQKLPGTLAQLKVKHRNAPRDVIVQSREIKENRPGKRSGKGAGGITLDLRISAPRQIFVRGRGLDAELGGDVTVTGTSNAPNVAGGFKMLRGRLSIIGRRLDFTQGTITFGGDMMPALNLVASSTVEATTVNVTVSGLANNPAVAFTSSPYLPQDEVMALLIFGRSSADLSPVQIAQLADAVATLAGGQSNSLFNKLRQGLGVDDLDVGTDENGKSNVSVGKYLNKRTYLQFQQGVDNSTSKAIINLDIGKGVKLRGEAGTDNSTAGGIFFEKEY